MSLSYASYHLDIGLPLRIDGRIHTIMGWLNDQVALKPNDDNALILMTQNEIASGIALCRIEIDSHFQVHLTRKL